MFGSTRKEPKQDDPAVMLVREVGAQLREARIARGEELEHAAENLRIRPSYLRGLEQGDLSVMPGRTYALGFLRSYARYLGFDGDDLIAQIKSSVAGLTGSAHLHGRSPLAESRLPKLPILVISLAALAGIYAGWAWVDDQSRTDDELVAEVPEDLQPPAAAPLPAVTPAIAPAPEITPVVEPEIEPETPPAAGLETVGGEPAMPEPAAGEQAGSSAPAPTSEPSPGAELAAAAAPAPPAGGESPTQPAAPEAADVLAALDPVADADAPTIYRDGDGAARVMLRARTSAWVHVSSTSNDYLWVRTLQPGDAFLVPDRPDLVLWTGNAGGIEVILDGEPLPPLGPAARVVRDVSLQPQALLRRLQPAPAAGAASGR